MSIPTDSASKAFTGSALPCLLAFILLLLLIVPGLPTSFARTKSPSRPDNPPQTPAVTFAGIYSQTNLVSDLPGVALVEDRQLVNPWGIAGTE